MEEKKEEKKNARKLTYEELENVARQLSEQNKQLYAKVQFLEMGMMFKRLDYLFKVLEFDGMYSNMDKDFVSKCSEELKSIMMEPSKSE